MHRERVRMHMEGMIPDAETRMEVEATLERAEHDPAEHKADVYPGGETPPLSIPTVDPKDVAEALRVIEKPPPGTPDMVKLDSVTPDDRLSPSTFIPPGGDIIPKGTVVVTGVDPKFNEELLRINAEREACQFIIANTIRQIEDRFTLLTKQQNALWARLRDQYKLGDDYVYRMDHEARTIIVIGRFDSPEWLQPRNFK